MATETLNISLTGDLSAFVEEKNGADTLPPAKSFVIACG